MVNFTKSLILTMDTGRNARHVTRFIVNRIEAVRFRGHGYNEILNMLGS